MRGFGLPLTDVEVILLALKQIFSFTKMHLRYTRSYENPSRQVFEIFQFIVVE